MRHSVKERTPTTVESAREFGGICDEKFASIYIAGSSRADASCGGTRDARWDSAAGGNVFFSEQFAIGYFYFYRAGRELRSEHVGAPTA
jgi:hypothetical protein